MNILVFPCGSEIGLEIHRAFKGVRGVKLVGASSVHDHGEFVYGEHHGDMPPVDHSDFIAAINALVRKADIGLIFPAHDGVILKLAQNLDRLECDVVGSPAETCEIARSKRKTYVHFREQLLTPAVYDAGSSIPLDRFPLFLKPDIGQGSKGTALARNPCDLHYHLAKDPSLLVLEYLPGEEYTVDCFTDFTGKLLFCGGRTRSRIINGISVRTQPLERAEFGEFAHKINRSLRLNGAWFFQLKVAASGAPALLEIAPRVAGASAVNRVRGINFPVLSYYNQLRIPVRAESNEFDLTLERSWSNRYRIAIEYGHVYVDFDDCLCIDGKANSDLVGFLYQCLGAGKQLHLLSRHAGNLGDRLAGLRLGQLFDTCTVIGGGEKKSRYITHRDAIFIDDSFAERSEVQAALGIPVFSVDAVECLWGS